MFSGALSLGGLCGIAISPLVGRYIDRYGSGAVLSASSAVIGGCGVALSFVGQIWAYYAVFVPGRAVWAAPLELSTSVAVSNWFIKRRALALAILGGSHGIGLAAMPLVAQMIIIYWGWRVSWASLGIFTLSIGVIPTLLIARRPEDMAIEHESALKGSMVRSIVPGELALDEQTGGNADFTLRQALRTRSFWVLSVFSAAGFLVQGGVVLHQVPHFIAQGIPASSAVVVASVFALSQVVGGMAWANLAGAVALRFLLAATGLFVALGGFGTGASSTLGWGLLSASVLGIGVGGLHLLLRLVWADFYGRGSLGSIRGVTLPVQLAGQLLGPIIAGFWFDATASYRAGFFLFAAAASLASVLVLAATPPKIPD